MRLFVSYVGFFLTIILFALVGLFYGPSDASLSELTSGLIRSDDGPMKMIIWSIRIPRIILSLLTGCCLGLSGALIQFSSRSAIGDPNLFGIGGGASIFLAGSYAGIFVFDEHWIFFGAIISSLVMSLILSRLISSRDLTPVKLAIMGIALGTLTISIGTAVISFGRVFPSQVIGLVAGSFTSSNWDKIVYLLIILIPVLLITSLLSKRFYPIMLGDVLSKSLGVNPIRNRNIAMSLAGILSGASVYAGGLIGFVGLIAPHLSRRILGNNPYHLILGSTILGALLALFSDQLARLLFAPTELPVGMATTILGAPMMMYLAWRLK
ncbi:MAG: hypothetical protein CL795_02290 [Chloroflexi bacterium]|nr:hypothetical protein [Chloroflexota bacterium]|tara:strand:+ start:186 stop:1157 length:972 start_codon:yes stop_codon:yes gene_type:complete